MQEYVLGYLFDETLTHVALIEKLRPDWQAGRLNGIGGKIEAGESPAAAMRREFMEEAGVRVPEYDWVYFGKLQGSEFVVHLFAARSTWKLGMVTSVTDEEVTVARVAECLGPSKTLPNVRWQIPMARERLRAEGAELDAFAIIQYP